MGKKQKNTDRGVQPPRGVQDLPEGLQAIVSGGNAGDKQKGKVIAYVSEQVQALVKLEQQEAEVHWKIGAGIQVLLETVLKGTSNAEKDQVFGKCRLKREAATDHARVFCKYQGRYKFFCALGYANAKELAAFKPDVAQRIYEKVLAKDGRITYEAISQAAKEERHGQQAAGVTGGAEQPVVDAKSNEETAGGVLPAAFHMPQAQWPVPGAAEDVQEAEFAPVEATPSKVQAENPKAGPVLRPDEVLNFGTGSRGKYRSNGVLFLKLNVPKLDEEARTIVERLLAHLTGQPYRLPQQSGDEIGPTGGALQPLLIGTPDHAPADAVKPS